VIKGFDTAVTGLAVGQSNKVRVTPEDAYGQVGREERLRRLRQQQQQQQQQPGNGCSSTGSSRWDGVAPRDAWCHVGAAAAAGEVWQQ
jgi:FKBP-type peptidyl-prolyl cis-trans isomerase 2